MQHKMEDFKLKYKDLLVVLDLLILKNMHHYHWVKDIMCQSEVLCPEDAYNKLKNYFKGKDGRS